MNADPKQLLANRSKNNANPTDSEDVWTLSNISDSSSNVSDDDLGSGEPLLRVVADGKSNQKTTEKQNKRRSRGRKNNRRRSGGTKGSIDSDSNLNNNNNTNCIEQFSDIEYDLARDLYHNEADVKTSQFSGRNKIRQQKKKRFARHGYKKEMVEFKDMFDKADMLRNKGS